MNEPWPGTICDILQVGYRAKKKSVVFEFRQDLICLPAWKEKMESDFIAVLEKIGVLGFKAIPAKEKVVLEVNADGVSAVDEGVGEVQEKQEVKEMHQV